MAWIGGEMGSFAKQIMECCQMGYILFPFGHVHYRTSILLFPWKPRQILKYHGNQNYCGPISGLFFRGNITKSHSFLARWSLEVRISNFHGNRFKIFNSGSTTTSPDHNRSTVPNFIEIG